MARILVIDNSNNGALVSKHLLEKEGYNIDGVQNFEEGILLAKDKEPDLIILDLDTSEINDLVRILSTPLTSSIPVVVTATNSNNLGRMKCIAAIWNGARDYVLKPLNTNELIQRIHAQMTLS